MSDPLASEGLDDLAAELDQTFRHELTERLARMRELLSQLETDQAAGREAAASEAAALDDLTRHAHSIKGGAMLVGRAEIARLAGALETYFAGQTSAKVAGRQSAAIRASIDLMARLGAAGRAGANAAAAADPSVEAEVQRLANALAEGDKGRR